MTTFTNFFQMIKEWLAEREAQKKSDALYNKLHRYHVGGKPTKFSQKDALKAARAAIKQQMKKNSDIRSDIKEVRDAREAKEGRKKKDD
jgi:hypothetical protein